MKLKSTQDASPRFRGVFAGIGALCVAGSMLTSPALAQNSVTGPDEWQFEVTTYLWTSGMKGDIQTGPLPKTSVDVSFSDVLSNLDFGLMGAIEARKNRWGFMFEGMYMNVSGGGTQTVTGPGSVGATASVNAGIKVKQTMLTAAAAYRAIEGPTALDLIGGARYSKLDLNASIDGSVAGQTGARGGGGDKGWTDPIVGMRVLHRIDDRWTLAGYADIGGFGVGSDLSWQAYVGMNYAFSKSVIGRLGYRYLSTDYHRANFLYDIDSGGVLAGISYRF